MKHSRGRQALSILYLLLGGEILASYLDHYGSSGLVYFVPIVSARVSSFE